MDYFIDATLLNYQLVVLEKYKVDPQPKELGANHNIEIRIYDDKGIVCVGKNCHIDTHKNRRVRLTGEMMAWIRQEFPFSVAYFESYPEKSQIGIWRKRDISQYYAALEKKKNKKTGEIVKMDIPGETIKISWVKGSESYLKIEKGFQITPKNATEYLSPSAIASVLPYIFASTSNISMPDSRDDGSKCYFIDRTTDWLSVKGYSQTSFSHPGLYLLRRKTDTGRYAYYVGKTVDIKKRIINNDSKVFHPDEKYADNKQYDDIACISIKFDDILKLYDILDDSNKTKDNNPGVSMGSKTDNALYAVEDIAIHVAAMLLKSEGIEIDNKQYRNYTSQWLNNNRNSEGTDYEHLHV